jgi:multiple sugar transport system permease protein
MRADEGVRLEALNAAPRSRWQRITRSEHLVGWSLAGPAVFLVALFAIFPFFWSLVLSFQENNLLSPKAKWVGWANYDKLAHDPIFTAAIRHTLIYTSLFVPLSIVGGLFVAVAVNRKIHFVAFYRTAIFITLAISTISTAIMFLWLTDPTFGLVNEVLHVFGIGPQQFLSSTKEALYVIVAMDVWGWLGFTVIIYLAALQGVPQELYEAAAIDGASPWSTFRRVTFPLLGPATLFLVIWLTINALQLFAEVYLTTRGGPLFATTVIVYYLFHKTFEQFDAGLGAAAAWVLFTGILALSLVELWIGRRKVHYSS